MATRLTRIVGEAVALVVLVLGLWTVPAMVSQGQDRLLDARHVDSALVGQDAAARALLAEADALALQLMQE